MLTDHQHLENLCGRFKGKRSIHSNGDKVYVRFTNLHDACTVHANARYGGHDWLVDFVRPEFWLVSVISSPVYKSLANIVASCSIPVPAMMWLLKAKSCSLSTLAESALSVT